jgi:hypothetical protein
MSFISTLKSSRSLKRYDRTVFTAWVSRERGAIARVRRSQRTLGHTSLDTTNKYLHVSPEDSSSRYLDA